MKTIISGMIDPIRKLAIAVLFIFLCASVPGQQVTLDTATVYPFGKVFLYSSKVRAGEDLIIMISGDGGWKFGVPEFAREFAKSGAVVAGVDILAYFKHLRGLKSDCYHVFSDYVELASAVERRFGFSRYTPPVLMGYSSGATLVYGILSQARPGTFIGGISLGFCPDIELPKKLCETGGLRENVLKEGKSYLLLPDARLGNPWIVLQGRVDKVCDFRTVEDFIKTTANARLVALDKVGHGFAIWGNFMPQWKNAYADLIKSNKQEATAREDTLGAGSLSQLPLKVISEKQGTESGLMTIMFSGDGGWYGFEDSLSGHLGTFGIPVVGIDTKKYLWSRKTPEQAAADIAEIARYYGEKLNRSGIILFGYSQGAEILPFIYDRLPRDIRERVKSLVMLSPETNTDFEIHITNMLGLGNRKNSYEVIPEMKKDTDALQVIVLGDEEHSIMADQLRNSGVKFISVPGDHHYKGNAALIIGKLEEAKIF
jgi:type IV secretory pathway VirJ component